MRSNAGDTLDPRFQQLASSPGNPALRSPHGDYLPGFHWNRYSAIPHAPRGIDALRPAYGHCSCCDGVE